ncbi:MAG: diguanylate cyclase [Proteobacteria bacterium]|nr:diguanylate cyclase [Pseudomonadota bacterium]MBU1714420.1 diguanylate cyclase [Pseudomonadota bacterium]
MARILVVGNGDLISADCRVVLEAKGYQLIFCSELSAAVGVILEDPPDLLIVERGFKGDSDLRLVKVAGSCLQKAFMPILLVVHDSMLPLDWSLFPVDDILRIPFSPEVLLTRLQLAESRMVRLFDNNPLSKLPGNTSIIKAITRVLDSGDRYGVCYVDIDNFKPYNDRYGFSQGDEVILMVARLIVNTVEEIARDGSFVGHVGGDDFVFVVKRDMVDQVCRKILSNFSVVRNIFISPEDLKVGAFIGQDRLGRDTKFELLSISIAVVCTEDNNFKHYGEVSASASQLKSFVKKKSGNNYMIDRRGSYHPVSIPRSDNKDHS